MKKPNFLFYLKKKYQTIFTYHQLPSPPSPLFFLPLIYHRYPKPHTHTHTHNLPPAQMQIRQTFFITT